MTKIYSVSMTLDEKKRAMVIEYRRLAREIFFNRGAHARELLRAAKHLEQEVSANG